MNTYLIILVCYFKLFVIRPKKKKIIRKKQVKKANLKVTDREVKI